MLEGKERFDVLRRAIARKISRYIAISGITKSKLSQKAGISRMELWKIMNCKCDPRLSTLSKLEDAIGSKLTIPL